MSHVYLPLIRGRSTHIPCLRRDAPSQLFTHHSPKVVAQAPLVQAPPPPPHAPLIHPAGGHHQMDMRFVHHPGSVAVKHRHHPDLDPLPLRFQLHASCRRRKQALNHRLRSISPHAGHHLRPTQHYVQMSHPQHPCRHASSPRSLHLLPTRRAPSLVTAVVAHHPRPARRAFAHPPTHLLGPTHGKSLHRIQLTLMLLRIHSFIHAHQVCRQRVRSPHTLRYYPSGPPAFPRSPRSHGAV